MMQHFCVDVWLDSLLSGRQKMVLAALPLLPTLSLYEVSSSDSALIWWRGGAWPCPFMNRRGCRVQTKTSAQPTHMSAQVWNRDDSNSKKLTMFIAGAAENYKKCVGQYMFLLGPVMIKMDAASSHLSLIESHFEQYICKESPPTWCQPAVQTVSLHCNACLHVVCARTAEEHILSYSLLFWYCCVTVLWCNPSSMYPVSVM